MAKLLKSVCLFCAILTSVTLHAEFDNYGLYIKSNPYDNEEKTSLIIEDGKSLKLAKETSISFDIQVRSESIFGLVCRLVTNNNDNVDLTFTVGDGDKRYPMLVVNESVHILPREIKGGEQWYNVSIDLSSVDNSVTLKFDGEVISAYCPTLSNGKTYKAQFGLCSIEGFAVTDIASVNIRDVKVFNNQKLMRHWRLDSYMELVNKDLIANVPAKTINAEWLSETYSSWVKVYRAVLTHTSHMAYSTKDNLFYIYEDRARELIVLNPETRVDSVLAINNRCLISNGPSQMVYCPRNNTLLMYNVDENLSSWFDFNTNAWSNTNNAKKEYSYWNNSTAINPADSTYISFGGYGYFKYNSELLRINPFTNTVKKFSIPDITPRYNSSTIIVDNTLYIFGGRGNKSGRQELSPRNYYDFYSVDLQTKQINKLWAMEPSEGVDDLFLPSENMIYNEEQDCFYLLANLDGGTLFRIDAYHEGIEQVSFPTGLEITATYSYRNIYYNAEAKKLYALIYSGKSDATSELNIYSLSYPPVIVSDKSPLGFPNAFKVRSSSYSMAIKIVVASILIVLLVGTILIVYYRLKLRYRKRGLLRLLMHGEQHDEELDSVLYSKGGEDDGFKEIIEEDQLGGYYDFSKQSINFLGVFSIKNEAGDNITNQFTPMLKHLLIILILSSAKNKRGIASRELLQIFWFDKDDRAAKNNRNVYLSKLRGVLEGVGDVEIDSVDGYLTIQLSDDINCDYLEVMRLAAPDKNLSERISEEERSGRLLELLLRGSFLPNTEEDWLDSYKSSFSNLAIDVLIGMLSNENLSFSNKFKNQISDTIFLHDPINEFALHIKCSTLFESGKKGLAKNVYDNFKKEYKQLLGTSYKRSLEEVVSDT